MTVGIINHLKSVLFHLVQVQPIKLRVRDRQERNGFLICLLESRALTKIKTIKQFIKP